MNRPEDLRAALESVFVATDPPDYVLVSDDSRPERSEAVRAVAKSFVRVDYHTGPRIGLGANRNACLSRILQNHEELVDAILFVDDDVQVPKDHFVRVRERWRHTDGRTIVTGGEDKHPPMAVDGKRSASVWTEPARVGFWGTQTSAHGGKPNAIVINATAFPVGLFAGGVKFDERLKFGSEEVDVCRQAIARGFTIVFEPQWRVDHYPAAANRDAYLEFLGSSYMYATLKGHLLIDRRPARFLAFALLGPPRSILQQTRRYGIKAGFRSARQAVKGFGLLLAALKERKPL